MISTFSTPTMLKKCIEKLICGKSLSREETRQAADEIFNNLNPYQTVAFLVLMRAKGELPEEILGVVDSMRSKMLKLNLDFPVLDIVGTGGDCANTVNISTGAAILAASCGAKVAKHGNRSVSSKCGAADVLEALGVNIQCSPQKTAESIEKTGFGFCFAPLFHPVMGKLKELRKELGIPTLFNIIGPLLNPAGAEYLMIGTFNKKLADLLASVFAIHQSSTINRQPSTIMVFHSSGLDELSCASAAEVAEITPSGVKNYVLDPTKYGFKRCAIEDLRGGGPRENAEILRNVFNGKQGAITDTLIFNAAVGLHIYGKTGSIEEAILMVRESIKNGKATATLNKIIEYSRE